MIICDDCGAKLRGAVKAVPTKEDPYGENTHYCNNCQEERSAIYSEVRKRVNGIVERAIERRLKKREWERTRDRIVITDPEIEF